MKIVAISDTHDQHHKITIPECDILIHAGDATCHRFFRETDYLDFIDWFKRQPAKHKIMVAGNHDTMWETNFFQYHTQAAIENLAHPIIYLQDNSISIEGLQIYGTPWTPQWDQWAFQKEDQELLPIFQKIPSNLDILIVHGPPKDILDKGLEHSGYGSKALRGVLECMEVPPRYVIFGHVHNKGHQLAYNNIMYCNVAMCQVVEGNNNNLVNEPTVIEL